MLTQRLASRFADNFGFAAFELGIAPYRKKPLNVTTQDIRPKAERTRAIFHIKELKQNLAHTLKPLYIIFRSWEDLSPFSVPFRINAEELSIDVEGTLEISVSKGRMFKKKIKGLSHEIAETACHAQASLYSSVLWAITSNR